MNENRVLTIDNLTTVFKSHKQKIQAVRGVSLYVDEGDILAIVGESGSGKSVTMKSVMGLLGESAEIQADHLEVLKKDLLSMSEKEKEKMRGKDMAMIFQDPMTALNPLKKIGNHMTEVLCRHQKLSKKEARKVAVDMLAKVGISSPESRMEQYPHEFSGGMRQRVMIAMALCCQPRLLIADEPTTALDVTIQAQILQLLKQLNETEHMNIILITHDLGVVASLAKRIEVMYGGLIMEEGTTEEIFENPTHPYTRALLHAIPKCESGCRERLEPIPGMAPSLANPPEGCPFVTRCKFACEECKKEVPLMRSYSDTQSSRCIFTKRELDEKEKKEAADLRKSNAYLIFNFLLTVGVIALLSTGIGKSYVIFMLGLCILLAVNYPNQKLQDKLIKKHAPAALIISATLFAAGAMVGVFDGTGMLEAMANAIMAIIPAALGKYVHIIFGILALPLGLCVGTDAYFYGIMPLVMQVGETYGVASLNTALTMLIGKNLALMVSPLVPATYLAIGLTGTELKDHMKFSIPPYYIISLIMLVFGVILGVVAI